MLRAGVDSENATTSKRPLNFIYGPIWDATLEAILTYLCQPLSPGKQNDSTQLDTFQNHFGLDIALLREVTQHVQNVRKAGSRIRAGCPVHLSTIGRSRHWSEYLALIKAMPPEVLGDIVFVVTGIDETTPATRLFNEVPKLCSRAKSVFAAVSRPSLIARLANTGIHAVGIKLPRLLRNEQQTLAEIAGLAREARGIGAETFVLGVQSSSIVSAAITAGVRYLEGNAIWPALTEPKFAFAHKMTELYEERAFIP